jgi:hypothetical protein
LDEGPNFVLFLKAYYEWMESEGQAINQSRSLFDLRDIDNTLPAFLEHFQLKYLYGIPFNVIINKQFLLKHILDVYRSKGTIQCYRLLFKLIYDQDVEIYLPSQDVLKLSDGTWVQPEYIEVTNVPNLQSYVGQTVVGTSSDTTAIIESFITEPVNQNIIATLFLSNMKPQGGSFVKGEKVVIQNQISNTAAISSAPTVIGSLSSLTIINGGQGFNVGDTISIVHRSLVNNAVISHGVDGQLRVTGVARGQGQINFALINGGFGYTTSANVFVYNGPNNAGSGANFTIGGLSYNQVLQYNTDIIADYYNTSINAASYGFPGNTAANDTYSTIGGALSFTTNTFGTIASLTNITTGTEYTQPATVFVRSTQLSSNGIPGTITYSTTANTITLSGSYSVGDANGFPFFYSANDVIALQANSSNAASLEFQVVKSVDSNTQITLWGPPHHNSTSSAIARVAPVILPSQYALYDPVMYRVDNTIDGENESILANPSSGNNIIASVTAIDSGKGYLDGEVVTAYLFGGLTPLTIFNPGVGYANGDAIIFSGGGSTAQASGYVTTDANGSITAANFNNGGASSGSGYASLPTITIRSVNGMNGVITTSIQQFNTFSQVTGQVIKSGVGKKPGYWSTTKGFLDSDKYIQDSYYYQDFSYVIKVAATLDKYKDIIYNTFHTSGSELFGEFYQLNTESVPASILYEQNAVVYESYLTIDSTVITSDTITITIDQTNTI